MCKKRFDRNAVASSDGQHTRVSHDRRANTTGRTPYLFCGKPVIVSENNVFRDGKWIGRLHINSYGQKCVYGPLNKGRIEQIPCYI